MSGLKLTAMSTTQYSIYEGTRRSQKGTIASVIMKRTKNETKKRELDERTQP